MTDISKTEPVPATNQAGEVERQEALRALVTAASEYQEAAHQHISDTRYDEDGNLAARDAELAVVALPRARAALATQPVTSQEGELRMGPIDDHEKAYFERGMFAAYAWMMTKKQGELLSDAVVDRAWDNRDAGMGPAECLPRRPLAATPAGQFKTSQVQS